HDLRGVLAGLVDRDGVNLLPEESPELVVERPELGPLLRGRREGMDVVEKEVPEEQLAEKRSPRPRPPAGPLPDLSGFLLAGGSCLGGSHGGYLLVGFRLVVAAVRLQHLTLTATREGTVLPR